MSHNNSTCSRCGKPLTFQNCIACEGSGFIRELTLIKRKCRACDGSGRVWRCEDEFKHIVDDFKASHPARQQHPPQTPIHRLTREPQEHNELDTTPGHSVHPENPWNATALNVPVKAGSTSSTRHPVQRSTGKTSRKK
jgi:hypothetical protein